MWLLLSFLTAFFISLQDIYSKRLLKFTDVYVVTWGWSCFTLPVLYGLLIYQKIPPLGAGYWKVVIIATILLVFALLLYIKAIQSSDLSVTVPMLSFSPLFLLITSPVMLGEFPRPLGLVGVFLIVAGSYTLFLDQRKHGWLHPFKCLIKEKGPRYMLIVAFIFSITANFDKMGVLLSSPLMWILTTNTLLTIALTTIMLKRSKNIKSQIIQCGFPLVLLGTFNALGLLCQMTAVKMAIVPYVISIKRTSVIMTSLMGFLLFKEKGFKERFVGIILMVLGAVFISTS